MSIQPEKKKSRETHFRSEVIKFDLLAANSHSEKNYCAISSSTLGDFPAFTNANRSSLRKKIAQCK